VESQNHDMKTDIKTKFITATHRLAHKYSTEKKKELGQPLFNGH
jgi:hypothetical protein